MKPPLRALITCVNFSHELEIALPHNLHHFSEILIVTHHSDHRTHHIARTHNVNTLNTNAFYNNNAHFAKYAAIEHALDHFGRHGWLCLIDADTLWPKHINWPDLEPHNLYGTHRVILNPITTPTPPDDNWHSLPIQKNSTREICGFTQIFHASDPHLKSPPWHDTTIPHAGKGDSLFNQLWPKTNQIRLPFTALHLGKNGQDWNGRKL